MSGDKEMVNNYLFMKNLITVIFLFFISVSVFSQPVSISGIVLDSTDENPIPDIAILTGDAKIGTITTSEGKFSIKVPSVYAGEYLFFTGVSYQKDSILIRDGNFTIHLQPKVYVLNEVYVMPDSTLLTLLERAYKKIPDNYPTYPTSYQGFYRESVQNENKEQVDFTESILGIYKEPYHNNSSVPGQIELIQSRKKNIQSVGVLYYGGPFLMVNGDVVLRKADYIVPKRFRKYSYQLNGIKTLKGKDYYEIGFVKNSIDSAHMYSGTMLIDKESLAYVSFEVNSNGNPNVLRFRDSEQQVQVLYEKTDDKWYLNYYSYKNEHVDRFNEKKRYINIEFMTTYIKKDSISPIPYDRRLAFTDPISKKANNYDKKGWTDYDVLDNGDLEQPVFQFTIEESKNIFQNQQPLLSNRIREALFTIMSNMYAGINVSYKPVSVSPAHLRLQFIPNKEIESFDINKEQKQLQETVLTHFIFGYNLNKRWDIYYQGSSDFSNKSISSGEQSVGVNWKKNITNESLPCFINASCNFSTRSYFVDLGKYNNPNSFQYKGRKFDSQSVSFDYGIRQYTVSPQFALSKNISRLYEMKIYLAYHIPIHEKKVLRIKEPDGSIFTGKRASISSKSQDLNVRDNLDLWNSININEVQVGIQFTIR
jgi:hypothetical protein